MSMSGGVSQLVALLRLVVVIYLGVAVLLSIHEAVWI